MDKDIVLHEVFSQNELILLYDACLSYGGSLLEACKKINGCPEATAQIDLKAKEAYAMAARLTKWMKE